MKKVLAGLALAGAIIAPTSNANAQLTQNWSPFCIGSNTIGFCANGSLNVDGAGNVTLIVANLSDGGTTYGGSLNSMFNNIGLYNLLGKADLTTFTSSMSGWSLTNGSGPGTTQSLDLSFDATTQGADKSPVFPGEAITFTFNVTGFGVGSGGPDLYVKSQSRSLTAGAPSPGWSIDCMTLNPGQTATQTPVCGPPITTTPEPASLALLGSGLVGIYGAFRRRRYQA